ncbi:uncharacterized protein LOC111689403 [Lucilia cuprina]|uniref:uncharacterized protein LOC111689403 n=1 Tax=Lucilia cuprina TaxID=7375 RepID=UPI001F06B7A3|nr:uncharacterized protein LOC111689403 [Lucilia cuprina]
MLSIQQLIKALRKLRNQTVAGGDLVKSIKHVAVCANNTTETNTIIPVGTTLMTSLHNNYVDNDKGDLKAVAAATSSLSEQQQQTNTTNSSSSNNIYTSNNTTSSQLPLKQQTQQNFNASHNKCFSLYSPLNADSSYIKSETAKEAITQDSNFNKKTSPPPPQQQLQHHLQYQHHQTAQHHHHHNNHQQIQPQQRTQRIQNFFQQQIFHQFHTQHNQNLNTKQKQTQFAMSSLAAEPLSLQKSEGQNGNEECQENSPSSSSSASCPDTKQQNSSTGKPCFNTGLGDILQFMELIGNLKHTKRTGWVLRNVNDCESISGHMYRMSILTFLLDGTEGLNQIRCMELALVHDLAESLVGDITPFCGVSKEEKKNMEFKAMEDICKLIEPRGKRMMELFEEYEHGESAESRFVKDLDRLDMVMQAFEYEKRDDCLLKHQEFFDSTEGKFNHPFVKKLVNEIYEQRDKLAKAKGAVPPPKIEVPNMDEQPNKTTATNGHCTKADTNGTTTPTKSS